MQLKLKDTGASVRYPQIWLRRLRMLDDVADGIFGNKTLAAVRKFQEVYWLPITGVIDDITYLRLRELSKYRLIVGKGGGFVEMLSFPQWFNTAFQPYNRALFPHAINAENFEKVFGDLDVLTGIELISNQEFIGHFCIIYNETGGTFAPLNEWGGDNNLDSFVNDAYFFEFRQNKKQSYNKAPNLLAGNQLKAWGVISSDADVAIWNNQLQYPWSQPETVRRMARNCDFYKFRGRGLNQLTWREGYRNYVNPALAVAGLPNVDQLTEAQLTEAFKNPLVYCGVFREFANDPNWAGIGLKALRQGIFTEYPKYVAGLWAFDYHKLYVNRCLALHNSLKGNLKIV